MFYIFVYLARNRLKLTQTDLAYTVSELKKIPGVRKERTNLFCAPFA